MAEPIYKRHLDYAKLHQTNDKCKLFVDLAQLFFDLAQMMACVVVGQFCEDDAQIAEIGDPTP